MLNSIAPLTNLVSSKEDLSWQLMSSQKIKKDDCIRFSFANPYLQDAPESYSSFNVNQSYSKTCKVSDRTHSNSHRFCPCR